MRNIETVNTGEDSSGSGDKLKVKLVLKLEQNKPPPVPVQHSLRLINGNPYHLKLDQ